MKCKFTQNPRLFRVMKFQMILFLVTQLNVVAGSFSQKITLDMSISEKTIQHFFAEIESQTGYQFIYRSDIFEGFEGGKIAFENLSLKRALKQVLIENGFAYKLKNNTIIVRKLDRAASEQTLTLQDLVRGKVISDEGEPLIGASVYIKGTTTGTTTDLEGNFSLDLPPDAVIVISYVGFETREIIYTGQTTLEITLVSGKTLENIVVLGSRGKPRTTLTSPVPVDNIGIETLQKSGRGVIDQQLMFRVPSYNSTQQPISDAAAHFSPADLRGLFPSRTLVLVNGKRKNASALVYSYVTPGRGEVGVDMKSIPTAALERIEILRDGAAAQYGSDAVAGVVNLVMKKSTDPFLNLGYSTTSEGDGEQYQLETGFGFEIADKGYANFTFNYFDQIRTQRAVEITSVADEAGYWGVTQDTDFNLADLTSFLAREPSAGFQVGIPDMNITNITFNSGFTLDEGSGTELYSFGIIANRKGSAPQFARVPYWVPGFQAIYPGAEFFLAEMAPQIGDQTLTLGLRTIQKGWNMDISSTLGRNRIDYFIVNSFNQSFAGSSPRDFYNGAHQFSHVVNNIDFNKTFKTGGTTEITTAFGVEHRTERFQTEAGEFASYGDGESPDAQGNRTGSESFPGFRPENESINFRSNVGIYSDVSLDFTENFLLGGALRFEDYSDFGTNVSWKLNTRYRIAGEKLSIRASVNNGFRAPALHQIYYTALTTTLTTNGVVQNGILSNDNPALRALGIPELKAETSFNVGLGITSQLSNQLTLTVDAYQVDVDDRIVLSGQVTQTGDPDSPIDRVLSGVGVGSMGFFLNAISTQTQGLDIVLDYKGAEIGSGIFAANLAANFNRTELTGDIETSDFIEENGLESNIFTREDVSRVETWRPRTKIIGNMTYELDKIGFNLSGIYYGEVTYRANNEMDDATYGGKFITDLSATYHFNDNIHFTLGAINLFNVYPDTFEDAYAENSGVPEDRNLDFVGRFQYPWQTTQFGIDGLRLFGRLNFNF